MPVKAGYILPHPPLLIPAVGGGREKDIHVTAEGYRRVAKQIAELRPDTIILFSPHSTAYADYIHISPGEMAHGSLSRFGASDVTEVIYDSELIHLLCELCGKADFPAGTLGEQDPTLDHGTLIPLHFIGRECTLPSLVRVSSSGLSMEQHYHFGTLVQTAAERLNRSAVIIASGDLSHKLTEDGPYGFAPEGPELDRALTEIMRSGDFSRLFTLPNPLCEKGAECGLRPFLMLAGALDGLAVDPELLSYEGPFGVGYAVASFTPEGRNKDRRILEKRMRELAFQTACRRAAEDSFVRLARITLEEYIRTGEMPPLPADLPAEMTIARAGVFVSIKKHGELRGCIGTTEPTQASIAEEIRQNAISSGTRDPRFNPVGLSELEELTYSVDVLSPAEPSDISMLDPARYGVIVTSGRKRGLLLPNLEGVDTVEQQVDIARRKAHIAAEEKIILERFEVVRHL